jgi:hypothetical protein
LKGDSLVEGDLRTNINQRPAMIDEIRHRFTWWVEWGSNSSPKWDTQKYGPELVDSTLPLISSIRDCLGEFSKSIVNPSDVQKWRGTLDIAKRLRDHFDRVQRNKKPS